MARNVPLSPTRHMRRLLASTAQVGEIFTLLSSEKEPDKGLTAVVKAFNKALEKQGKTGVEISEKELRGFQASLKKLGELPESAARALKLLNEFLGDEEEPSGKANKKGQAGKKGKAGGVPTSLSSFLKKLEDTPDGNLSVFSKTKLKASAKAGIYRARLIKAGAALDGTIWTAKALKQAVADKLFDDVPVKEMVFKGRYGDITNHLDDESIPTDMLFGNTLGFTKHAVWDPSEQAVYASVFLTSSDRQALIDAMIKNGVELPGLSIYARGDVADGHQVVQINKVDSMDFVTFPAAEGRILSKALTASVKNFQALLKAAEEIPALDDEAKASFGKPAESSEQEEAPPPASPEVAKFDKTWLQKTGKELAASMLAGAEVPEGVDPAVESAITEIGEGYDVASFPLEEYLKLVNAVYGAVFPDKQDATGGAVSGQEEEKSAPTIAELAKGEALGGAPMENQTVMSGLPGQRMARDVHAIKSRIITADTEEMVAERLRASGLSNEMMLEMAKTFKGKPVTEAEVEEFIAFGRRVEAGLSGKLSRRAAVTLDGAPVGAELGVQGLEASVARILGAKTFVRDDEGGM